MLPRGFAATSSQFPSLAMALPIPQISALSSVSCGSSSFDFKDNVLLASVKLAKITHLYIKNRKKKHKACSVKRPKNSSGLLPIM